MGASTNVAPVIIKRKKVVAGGGHHGGAWKVAYADFVTAMMAFFMLMWLLNATTENQRRGIADYFAPTVPVSRISGGGEGALSGDSILSTDGLPYSADGKGLPLAAEVKAASVAAGAGDAEALRRVEDALLGGGGESLVTENALRHVVTRLTDEGLVIELFDVPGRPLFDGETDGPTPLLEELANMVARVAGLVENGVALGAHVPARPVVLVDNPVWDLSASRAGRLRGLLEDAGMAPARIVRVTGHADRSLAVPDPMSERNSRLEVILLRRIP